MVRALLTMVLRMEHDVVLSRQRARQIAGLLGFDLQDQTRIATAVSEIARNAFRYAGGGKVEFLLEQNGAPTLLIRVRDDGPGIPDVQAVLDGRYRSHTGMGLGIVGARRLMDRFDIQSAPGQGTAVTLGKTLASRRGPFDTTEIATLAEELTKRHPNDPVAEIQQQNQELLRTLDELKTRQEDLAQLNRELEDTNRGVVALYAELDAKADYLQRASELKSRFLSNMSHEFRTPLNSILSLSQILLDRLDGDLTAEQDKQVRYIERSAETLSELVNDLLDLAKVEAGKVTVRAADFHVEDLFGALRGMLRPLLAGNASVTLTFEDPGNVPALHTDEGKVSQILRNFISNALKFTEAGEVRVSATAGPNDTIVFSVADTGIGIAPEDQERIFDEFAQVESAQNHRPLGTGLGLPLSMKLAVMLGGNILVESEPGRGSTFYAVIPRAYTGPTEILAVPDVTTRVDPSRLPVLIVEDNRETLFIYEKYLKGTDFQVIPAHTMTEARFLLQQVQPVAVVLDILLEGESAWDLLAAIKEDPATRSLPVLVVTVVDNERKATSMGAQGFCVKPVERAWLLERLSALTGRHPRPRVLLVDDEEVARYILRSALAETPCRILEAAGAAEALRIAQAEKPDAILLDLVMPGQNGWDVLKALKEDPRTRAIPVIVNTSQALSPAQREALEADCAAVLSKQPSSRQAAGAEVRSVLARLGILGEQRKEPDHVTAA